MPLVSISRDAKTLHDLINQADQTLALVVDPAPSIITARESLNAAVVISADLASRLADPLKAAGASMGARGGAKAAETRKLRSGVGQID
jgi:hypothetical protein